MESDRRMEVKKRIALFVVCFMVAVVASWVFMNSRVVNVEGGSCAIYIACGTGVSICVYP